MAHWNKLIQTKSVKSSYLLAAGVIQELNVAGMEGLSGIHWHQDHPVSNHHLDASDR